MLVRSGRLASTALASPEGTHKPIRSRSGSARLAPSSYPDRLHQHPGCKKHSEVRGAELCASLQLRRQVSVNRAIPIAKIPLNRENIGARLGRRRPTLARRPMSLKTTADDRSRALRCREGGRTATDRSHNFRVLEMRLRATLAVRNLRAGRRCRPRPLMEPPDDRDMVVQTRLCSRWRQPRECDHSLGGVRRPPASWPPVRPFRGGTARLDGIALAQAA
jgi:hypothetical protein